MWLIDRLVEARVGEARERGEFDDLPGAGRPLALEDDTLVPEELRAGYRLLKNAGYLPPELALRREIADVTVLLAQARAVEERDALGRRLHVLLSRLNLARSGNLRLEQDYYDKLRERLDGGRT